MVALVPRRTRLAPRHPEWGWRTEILVRTLQAGAKGFVAHASPRAVRMGLDGLSSCCRPPAVVRRTRVVLGGQPATTFTPPNVRLGQGLTLLHLHGGAYALGSMRTHRQLIAEIARATGAPTVGVEYRKAPENPFPGPIDDCLVAYRSLRRWVGAERIVLSGDSAGGGLVLAVLQRLRAAGEPMPAGAVLLSPWLDLRCRGGSIEEHARYDYLDRPALERFAQLYLQGADPSHPEASPIEADFRGLPPLLMHAGGAELLLDEIRETADRARAAGVEVELEVWDGMIHAFHGFPFALPQARQALAAVGRWVRARPPAGSPH